VRPSSVKSERKVSSRYAHASFGVQTIQFGFILTGNIAPEHQQKVFQRFYRVDDARSRAEGGVGLGLAIVKWAVERTGGTVELESEVGRGSIFRVRLPAAIK